MSRPLHELFPHEFEELLHALRRDLHSQQGLAEGNSEWAAWHKANTRMIRRLLEVLNPKSTAVAGNCATFSPLVCGGGAGDSARHPPEQLTQAVRETEVCGMA